MKCNKNGFTIVELLTVLGIISILVGLLMPSMVLVRRITRETKQKAQFKMLDLALLAFKNDTGNYPPSEQLDLITSLPYCGAQKLTEALMGWDLLGFHPKSAWRVDGYDALYPANSDGSLSYDPERIRDIEGDGVLDTLTERRGPYLDASKANAFRLGVSAVGARDGLFETYAPFDDTYGAVRHVICDSFPVKKLVMPMLTAAAPKLVKAGTPILYYRANTSSKIFRGAGGTVRPQERIYNMFDNLDLIQLGTVSDQSVPHPLFALVSGTGRYFYSDDYKIVDHQASATLNGAAWPHRPYSYILISAGHDGLYGTEDDICNFQE